jgi:hypothetical protein
VTQTSRLRRHALTTEHGVRGVFAILASLALLSALAAPAHAAKKYVFTKVADSVADDFNPNSFTCASINTRGDVAFRAARRPSEDGIHRADASGGLTTIAEATPGSGFGFFKGSVSMNDSGEVSFWANVDLEQAIMRGDGTDLTTIAITTRKKFASFGDNTSINDSGEVAFDGQLQAGDLGLFSGTGVDTTTHYLNSEDVLVDGNPARFDATSDRPSINNLRNIAFIDSIQGTFRRDIFVGQEGSFRTIPSPNQPDGPPVLNDGGTVAFQTSFLDDAGFSVRAIVKGDGVDPLTTVADSSGAFHIFLSQAINNTGAVAFSATLDSDELGIPSIFVGPSPKKDRVIGHRDKLDGAIVAGLRFCEEGLNDSGALTFIADLADPDAPDGRRVAVFRATPP